MLTINCNFIFLLSLQYMYMKKTFNWPNFSTEEIKLASRVLRSNKVNYLFGNYGKRFEDAFAEFSNCNHSLAVANGSLALDLCLRAVGICKGDEVLVTSRSYVASGMSVSLLGGIPVWCDVDLNSQNISIDEIKKKYSKRTKAILCVHFAGYPCDMKEILSFASKKNLFVIEDCAQAHGAKINGKSVGSFGDISAWSFCNDKIISTGGEGGMVTTNSRKLFKFVSSFNNHGKNLKKYFDLNNPKTFPYIHENIGTNYRLTEIQSAIGIYQLNKMSRWNSLRSRNAKVIINSIKDYNLFLTPYLSDGYHHAWYKLYLTIQNEYLKKTWSLNKIISILNSKGVECSFGGCGEMYKEKAFKGKRHDIKLKNASYLEKNSLMLLIHPTITLKEINRRAGILRSVIIQASVES